MILQALAQYYQRLLEQPDSGLAPYGYSPEKISYSIVLKANGEVTDVRATLDTSGKKPQPQVLTVPQPEKRTAGVKSNFLWDKTSYVLGVSATSKRADQEHAAFRDLHLGLLRKTEDAGLLALKAFLEQWQPAQFEAPLFPEAMKDSNVVFQLEGENRYLHERPAARALRATLLEKSPAAEEAEPSAASSKKTKGKASTEEAAASQGFCLISGEWAPVARLHPVVKGVWGAQSSGASIVSFQQESFRSFDKLQGANAPVSEQAAFAYTTALNHLLRQGSLQRLQVGDTSVVFWAEAGSGAQAQAAESLLSALFTPPTDEQEAKQVNEVLEIVQKGRPVSEARLALQLDPATRIYVLGLAPNASRLSIRFWLVDSLQQLTQKLAQHEADLRLEPLPWRAAPAVWRLALATAPSRWSEKTNRFEAKTDDVLPLLAGELMRAVLTGGLYPASLLVNTVMRMRTDGDLSGIRAAICKGVITRQRRLQKQSSKEEISVSLDSTSKQQGYLLGRLFATFESVQRNALGGNVNATIRDRYYGAASATPASIFPMLVRNAQNHLSKLRKERKGQAINLEKLIGEIVAGLPEQFPRTLNIEDQGRFAIGYYHQSQDFYTKRSGDDASAENALETTETQGEE
ncbi:type I-C CRISPR-associated protein Cas8c/Csd1 [Lampropedia puyangensis]|uniref:Type I-C CRISPR-associated protein Cas8c/Csd1 n=1 Tax=Lampropedia puyangensis TaxID=1330072 RepID=A0A4S8FC90_9BURK|nr:type I-C CRISPR-associated protein Cas8c/Csd1 [Lampropedia puyangensis]THU04475.1 type I-C CRISPR-associated protein Cas8c/Csd1 [Lampropedia puyangensis]